MLTTSPTERTLMWSDAVTSGPSARTARTHLLARELQLLLAETLDAVQSDDQAFDDSVVLLHGSGLLGDASFRSAFEAADASVTHAQNLLRVLAELLLASSGSAELDGKQRAAARRLARHWSARLAEAPRDGAPVGRFGTVREVAEHFDVTPQAVYRWIDHGTIQAERRPGGSYRVPLGQFADQDLPALRRAERAPRRAEDALLRSATSAAADELPGPDEGRHDPDDAAGRLRARGRERRIQRLTPHGE